MGFFRKAKKAVKNLAKDTVSNVKEFTKDTASNIKEFLKDENTKKAVKNFAKESYKTMDCFKQCIDQSFDMSEISTSGNEGDLFD